MAKYKVSYKTQDTNVAPIVLPGLDLKDALAAMQTLGGNGHANSVLIEEDLTEKAEKVKAGLDKAEHDKVEHGSEPTMGKHPSTLPKK